MLLPDLPELAIEAELLIQRVNRLLTRQAAKMR